MGIASRIGKLATSRHPVIRVVRVLVFAYVLLLGTLVVLEERMIFFPDPYPAGDWSPEDRALEADPTFEAAPEGRLAPQVESAHFEAEDGVALHGWLSRPMRASEGVWEPAEVPGDQVLLFFHGNAGNITHRYEILVQLAQLPLSVFLIDYRGYGKSAGSPNEAGLYRDAEAAWNVLTERFGYRPDQIILYGESLGGGVASELATRKQAGGLILQSTFTSIPDMAGQLFPFAPRMLVRTKMASLDKVAEVDMPVLVIHSPIDEVVPFEMGEELYQAAWEPKRFHKLPPIGHNEAYFAGGPPLLEAIGSFLELCRDQE